MNLHKLLTLPAGLIILFGVGYSLKNEISLYLVMGIFVLGWLLLNRKEFVKEEKQE